jgi:uncharacterized protein YuzE
MQIPYDGKTDLLDLRLDERRQPVMSAPPSEGVRSAIAEDNKIVGIEIFDASEHHTLQRLLPLHYEVSTIGRHHA